MGTDTRAAAGSPFELSWEENDFEYVKFLQF